jgi:hypothetical protein
MSGRRREADVIEPLNAKHLRGDVLVRPLTEFTPSPFASLRVNSANGPTANYAKGLHFCAITSLRDNSSVAAAACSERQPHGVFYQTPRPEIGSYFGTSVKGIWGRA